MIAVSPLRILLVRELLLVVLLSLAASVRADDEGALRAALDRVTGEWTGEAQIKAMDGFVLKTVSATRRATWEGDTLVTETVLDDGTGAYAVVARQSIRLGRLESSVTRPSQPVDRYYGELSGAAVAWTNAEGNRRDAREQVAERGGVIVLETSSVEPIRVFGLSGLVRVEGKFRRPAPAQPAAAPTPAAVPAVPTPALAAEVEALRRSLDGERAAVAEWRTRAEQAEGRAAAAESRAQSLETAVNDTRTASDRLAAELGQARQQVAALEGDRASTAERLAAAETRSAGVARDAESDALARRALGDRVAALEAELASTARERDDLRVRLTGLEQAAAQAQHDNEGLVTVNRRLMAERDALASRLEGAEARLAAAPAAAAAVVAVPPPPAAEGAASFSAVMREQLVAEVQRMERRVLELESERNTAREQIEFTQRQLEETRRLRDDTLLRFQTVVAELNAMREEKERLARANVSLQAEVRQAQQTARAPGPVVGGAVGPAPAPSGATPATTFDGKTADMIIAGLQIIGVTRGEGGEDKAILDGRVYRNGDLVEAQLGITFVGIDGNALVFQDRRGREYRRRF